jgi:hypothetical protein
MYIIKRQGWCASSAGPNFIEKVLSALHVMAFAQSYVRCVLKRTERKRSISELIKSGLPAKTRLEWIWPNGIAILTHAAPFLVTFLRECAEKRNRLRPQWVRRFSPMAFSTQRANSFDAARVLMSAQMRPVVGVFLMSFLPRLEKSRSLYISAAGVFFLSRAALESICAAIKY